MLINVQLHTPVRDSFHVQQVLGMFDLPDSIYLREQFTGEIPGPEKDWTIGVIVGPSGSGKTSIARAAFGDALHVPRDWPADVAVIDCLGDHPIRRLTQTLTAVGLGSPRSWLKPFAVLSNGERFRCELARAFLCGTGRMLEVESCKLEAENSRLQLPTSNYQLSTALVAFDEFTSVVDRTVARIGSAAISKAIRANKINARLVAITCHDDVIPWLEPDWVLDMASGRLAWGRVRRPDLRLDIRPATADSWPLFLGHHYLSGTLHRAARCFVGWIEGRPAAFTAVLPFPHPRRPGWREHRIVCLPDFQGIGIGSAMSDFLAGVFVATGKPYFSTTSHPAMIAHRRRSTNWEMRRTPGLVSPPGPRGAEKTGMRNEQSRERITAGFEYVGPKHFAESRALGLPVGLPAGPQVARAASPCRET